MKKEIDKQCFHEALKLIWKFISEANKYVDDQAPWKLKHENRTRMEDVLWILSDNIRKIAILTQAFMPISSSRILDQLSVDSKERNFVYLNPKFHIQSNSIDSPKPIFPRIDT